MRPPAKETAPSRIGGASIGSTQSAESTVVTRATLLDSLAMAPALEVRQLVKRYGQRRALGGVELEVAPGELVGLIGPNGAGKSTLTKIACGLVRPSSGTVAVCGHPAGATAARRRVGYLAELFRFPAFLTADEVLHLHQRLAGSSGGAPERAELLALVGLGEAPALRVGAMSKGM